MRIYLHKIIHLPSIPNLASTQAGCASQLVPQALQGHAIIQKLLPLPRTLRSTNVMALDPQSVSAREVTLEQMRALLEASPIPASILQWDKILYMNPAGVALLGQDEAEQIFQHSILKWTDSEELEEDRRGRLAAWMRQREQIEIVRKDWIRRDGKWIRRNGGTLVVEVRASAIPLAGGGGTQVSFTDVTSSAIAEQERLRHEDGLRLAVDVGAIGTWDLNPLTSELKWSKQCSEIFGLPQNNPIDYAIFLNSLHPNERERTHHAVQQSLDPNGNGEYSSDYRVVRPNGEIRWVAATGRAFFRNVNGRRAATRMVGTVLDVTDLRKTDASVNQTEKLAAAGRLAASLAHEINNPLESITNLLYLLQDSSLQPEQRKFVELAEQELARVVDLTTQTLRFYHEPGSETQCVVAEIIDSVLTLFAGRIIASNIQVERRYSEGASLLGAREELRQVLVNLIHNAMDAMPRGGRLLIRSREATKWHAGRNGVCLTVADTGHGMDSATMTRMFEPFFTTRTAVGTGLGLWLSAGIIRKHGGTIRVKSCQHQNRSGTVFSIFLPYDRRK